MSEKPDSFADLEARPTCLTLPPPFGPSDAAATALPESALNRPIF